MSEVFCIDFFGSKSFSAGQNVNAQVILHLPEPMKARSIDLHISGKAEVDWTETETKSETRGTGSNRRTHHYTVTIPYHSEQCYLNRNIKLWSSPDRIIPAGEHTFPFNFKIPLHCPPSFEGTYGHIRYFCSVNIDRPWRFDKKIKSTFFVTPSVDLNTIDWVRKPIKKCIEKTIGFCCCKHGKIKAKIQLPKSGFLPGESIPITIEIGNKTTKEVEKVTAKLTKTVRYRAQRKKSFWNIITGTKHFSQRENSCQIARMEKQFELAPHSKGTFQGHLAIPRRCKPSFNSNNCEFIQLSYSLQVNVVTTSFCFGTVRVPFRLLIGTVQIREQKSPAAESFKFTTPYPSVPRTSLPLNQPNASSSISIFTYNNVHSSSSSVATAISPSASSPYPYYSGHPMPPTLIYE